MRGIRSKVKFIRKDILKRKNFNRFEKKHLIFKFLLFSKTPKFLTASSKKIGGKHFHYNTNIGLIPHPCLCRVAVKMYGLGFQHAVTRIRNRCIITGRPQGVLRKIKVSRIVLKELISVSRLAPLFKKK